MRFVVYQLADDPETYGTDAGRWIVVTNDQRDECSGAMDEHDANLLCDCLNLLDKQNSALNDGAEITVNSDMHEDICLILYRTPK